jgi:hypothetical protein
MRYRGVEVDGICKHDHINMYTLTLETVSILHQ